MLLEKRSCCLFKTLNFDRKMHENIDEWSNLLFSLVSDHDMSGIMPSEGSIIMNEWTLWRQQFMPPCCPFIPDNEHLIGHYHLLNVASRDGADPIQCRVGSDTDSIAQSEHDNLNQEVC